MLSGLTFTSAWLTSNTFAELPSSIVLTSSSEYHADRVGLWFRKSRADRRPLATNQSLRLRRVTARVNQEA